MIYKVEINIISGKNSMVYPSRFFVIVHKAYVFSWRYIRNPILQEKSSYFFFSQIPAASDYFLMTLFIQFSIIITHWLMNFT